jgi:hypothetical protein
VSTGLAIPVFCSPASSTARASGSAVVSESLNSNSLNVLAGVALPFLVLWLGSASGLILRRAEGAAIVALYVAFVVVVASR